MKHSRGERRGDFSSADSRCHHPLLPAECSGTKATGPGWARIQWCSPSWDSCEAEVVVRRVMSFQGPESPPAARRLRLLGTQIANGYSPEARVFATLLGGR